MINKEELRLTDEDIRQVWDFPLFEFPLWFRTMGNRDNYLEVSIRVAQAQLDKVLHLLSKEEEAIRAELRDLFVQFLTVDSKTQDARRKDWLFGK